MTDTRTDIGNTYDNNKISRPSGRLFLVSQPLFVSLLEELARATYKAPPSAAPPQTGYFAAEGVRG